MPTPEWIGATGGQPQLAAHANQFLGTHAAVCVYTGTQQGGHTTLGSGSVATNGTWIAQEFTAGSSFALGRIVLYLAATGSPGPATVSIQTSSGGAPSDTVLTSTVLPAQFVAAAASAVSIPLPCPLASGTGYWIVVDAVGDAAEFFSWSESNQTSGASTSVDGVSWTAQSFGLYYSYWDQTAVPPLAHTWEDSGARWTTLTENSSGQPTSLDEYTTAQGAGQYVCSSRSMTYSSGNMVMIA